MPAPPDAAEAAANLRLLSALLAAFAFTLGACIGSFLNVCIYRMPRNLSVNEPRRSFCPHCRQPIPWHQNIPLFSWIALRARCARCSGPIPARYFCVELLTALLFLAIWLRCPLELAPAYWLLASLLVAATFIDLEHYIIPDEITWGGTAAGILLSAALPGLMDTASRPAALAWSVAGAASGFCLLWAVVELGKLAFGKKTARFDSPQAFAWTELPDDAEVRLGDDRMLWSDLFSRESDRLILDCESATVAGEPVGPGELRFSWKSLEAAGRSWPLESLGSIEARVTRVTIPREAMGFGDVKFIAAIGAFLGWKAVLFTIITASMAGALVGIGLMAAAAARKQEHPARVPFGPYLAFGALLWLFAGPQIVGWYIDTFASIE